MRPSELSNLRVKKIPLAADTVRLDTLSIVPQSVILMNKGTWVDTSCYRIDEVKALLIWKSSGECAALRQTVDSVIIYYRLFPLLFSKSVEHKNLKQMTRTAEKPGLYYNPRQQQPELFRYEGLNKSGSISRGVTFGNNQDVFVNSSLNLQLAGRLSDNLNILAAITDENIPIQPEGNTQQLQDFDKVYIQVYNDKLKLTAGDFELRRPESYFMNFYKKAQGGLFTTSLDVKRKNKPDAVNRIGAGAAVSKGKFSRNTIAVTEGNQGPYRLTGSNNETFIIVLAGTERVYIDGQPMERGLQNDYVIDYNTAEITFTARRLIRSESRVVVEFEYSEKSYARSLLYFNDEYETQKWKLKFNVYSEQDSKNQPLLLELDSARRAVMESVGDSIQNAYYQTGDSVAFSSSEVLYKKTDTTGISGSYTGIYVFSTNPDSAYWQVTFSNVGAGKGDYIQDVSSVNGRVFKWVEPVGGVHAGSYAPVILLITPKKQQMFTLGSDIRISKNNNAGVELALSNYDVNLFSNINKANDHGYAAKAYYDNMLSLDGDSTAKGWKLFSRLNYEFVNRDFKVIERYRNVEFERDWNLGTSTIYYDEHVASGQFTLSRQPLGSLSYQLRTYQKGPAFSGLQHASGIRANVAGFDIKGDGSLLNTKGTSDKSEYLRHNADVSKPIWLLRIGMKEMTEHNERRSLAGDTLTPLSFSFKEYSGYLTTLDSLKNHALLSYKKRYDDGIENGVFKPATEADEVTLTAEFVEKASHQVRFYNTYRELKIKNPAITQQEQTKTLLNRIDENAILWKGIVTANTFYEVGTGQERRLEYYFLEVGAGQGTYAYIGDLNGNGIKDLDEFQIAAFKDQANYVKVFTPTSQYISTRTNQFNEVLNINPAAAYRSFQGKQPLITRFSNLLSLRLDKKTQKEDVWRSLNPFDRKINDSTLLSTNSAFRNTLFFNRSAVVFGADVTWSNTEGKNLLLNGFETRSYNTKEANIRWNVTRMWLITVNYLHGDKKVEADSLLFASRNYHLISDRTEPKITLQPIPTFRLAMSYQYNFKKNIQAEQGEKSTANQLSLETKYNAVSTGNFTARVNYIAIDFTGSENSTIAYEMLEGLRPGKNFTWNASLQRSLGNSMQLSLNYEGRKSEDTKTVHTGGVQFRAYF